MACLPSVGFVAMLLRSTPCRPNGSLSNKDSPDLHDCLRSFCDSKQKSDLKPKLLHGTLQGFFSLQNEQVAQVSQAAVLSF